MKVITLIYHQRSIITTISTLLSVLPATRMGWRSRFCLNFGNFFFRSQFLQKNFTGPPIFFPTLFKTPKKEFTLRSDAKIFVQNEIAYLKLPGGAESTPPGLNRVNSITVKVISRYLVTSAEVQNRLGKMVCLLGLSRWQGKAD